MKRERALQVVLVLVGLLYSFWGYLLFDNLWHSKWLIGHSDVMPMFLSLNLDYSLNFLAKKERML
jgi:hypothetical protein